MNLAAPYFLGVGNGRFSALVRCKNGGEGGIRTRDTPKGIPVFETGAFNHSATSPCRGVPAEALPAGPKSSVG